MEETKPTEPEAEKAQPEQEPKVEEPLYKIKVKGEEKELPLSTILELARKGEDYTQKTMALAEERRRLEEERAQLRAMLEQESKSEAQPQETMPDEDLLDPDVRKAIDARFQRLFSQYLTPYEQRLRNAEAAALWQANYAREKEAEELVQNAVEYLSKTYPNINPQIILDAAAGRMPPDADADTCWHIITDTAQEVSQLADSIRKSAVDEALKGRASVTKSAGLPRSAGSPTPIPQPKNEAELEEEVTRRLEAAIT